MKKAAIKSKNTINTVTSETNLASINKALEKQRFELEALKSFSDRLANIFDISNAVKALNSYLGELLDFSAATYLMIDPANQDALVYLTRLKEPVGKRFLDGIKKDINIFLSKKENYEMQPSLTRVNKLKPEIIGLEPDASDDSEIKSRAFYPLDIGGTMLGVIHLASKNSGLYKENRESIIDAMIATFVLFIIRTQTMLRFQNSKTASLLKSLSDGIILFNDHLKSILINPSARKFLNLKQKNLTLSYLDQLFSDINISGAVNKILLGAKTIHIEEAKLKNKYFEIFFTPVKDNTGEIVNVAVILHDITKPKEIEKAKTDFVYIASHQLRTPLTGIKWFTKLMLLDKSSKLSVKQKEYLDEVIKSNNALIKLVNDLLNVSRFETGHKFEIVKEPVDIQELVREVLNNNVAFIKRSRAIMKVAIPNKHHIIVADSQKIKQVFHNLINNAIKYSHRGGTVAVGTKPGAKGETVFFVQDYGLGIPDDQKNRVFDKFFRADNVTTKVASGTGLGLFLVKAIVEIHGGKVWFESKENVGTTFYFSIPNNL